MSLCQRRERTTVRRRAALIGIAAILFQALLFGWHHHAIALVRSSAPVASVNAATAPLAPASAEDLCEICTVLHQQSAAPLAFILLPTPFAAAATNDLEPRPFHDGVSIRGFDARGPPAIERVM